MKLNRTPNPLDRNTRNSDNDNWDIIEGEFKKVDNTIRDVNNRIDNVIDEVSDDALKKVVDNAKLNWKEPIDKFSELPTNAQAGDTRMDKSTGKVYRYDGANWVEIQQIDAGPVNELDSRISSQLNETDELRRYESLINRKKPRPIITWVDDDGQRGVFTKLLPLAIEYGVTFTSAVATSWIGKTTSSGPYMTEEEIRECIDNGLEIVSHTHRHTASHRPVDMTDVELREDYKTSQSIIKALGGNYRALVHPFSTYQNRELEFAKEFFDYAVGTAQKGNRVNIPPFSNYELLRTSAELNDFETIKEKIDEAYNNNGWLIFTSHVDQGFGWTEEKTRQIIEYAKSLGVDFVTLEEGIKIHGNIAEFNGNSISATGKVFGNDLGRTVIDHSSEITGSTPISYFKENSVTVSRVNANRAGFPNDSSGILETCRLNNPLWSYQKFTVTRTGHTLYRAWNEVTESWNRWNGGLLFYRDKPDNITAQTRASNFHLGLTVCNIRSADGGSIGFPEEKPGVLLTYITTTGETGFNYQEYKRYDRPEKYIRYENPDGSWSSWYGEDYAHYLTRDSVTANTPASDFKTGLTMVRIRGTNAAGFPDDTGGMLTTYGKDTSENGWAYQEYKKFNSFDKYIRFERANDGNWSAWRKFVLE